MIEINREVYCTDAVEWLKEHEVVADSSLVASLPDISEFNLNLNDWKIWFIQTAQLVMQATPDNGVSIFYQTDIKIDGRWIDKAYLVQKAAEFLGHHQLFHKIMCRVPPGVETKGRPAYSHLLCFSRNHTLDIGKNNADVFPDLGDKTWERGMGIEATLMIAKFIKNQTATHTIINPFCGEGSMLAAANYYELNTIGIERSPKRAEKARLLRVIKGPDKKLSFSVI
jgi:hypothetical protein